MAGTGYYGYEELPIPFPPIVDHPHERLHQHQNFLSLLARRKPNPSAYPNYPDVDVRDTLHEYLVEIEVPGVKSAKDISCHWTSTKSLVVSGVINRPSDPEPKGRSESAQSNIGGQVESPTYLPDESPYLLVGERKIGNFRRVFNFPVDVAMDKMTAKLEAGLLRLAVPKKESGHEKKELKVKIDGGES